VATKDEDALEGLTADERAALEDGDEDELEALKEIAEDSDESDDGDEAPAAKDEPAATDEDQDAAADDESEEEEDEDDDEPVDLAPFTPRYQVDPVENFDQQIADFSAEKKSLREQLNNGDIDLDAYETAKDEIVAKEQALREQNLKATIASEQNQQNIQARWQWEQEKFFNADANKMYGANKLLMAAMDTAVKELAADTANADKSAAWFLEEADKQVRSAFGLKDEVKAPEDKKPKGRKPDLSVVPKTLSNLPAADLNETGGDEFANLDKLEGMALEAALNKLSPDQQARYLGAAA
jgi:hypothetical protein